MKTKKASNTSAVQRIARCPPPFEIDRPDPKLKHIGGSAYDDWNNIVACQAISSAWFGHNPDPDELAKQHTAILSFLAGVKPADELEGMLACQLMASHNAALECYRRAMLPQQTLEGRSENLSQANRLSRTHASLLETLNRHRGKGQQKVTVEHVHVHDGGQAIVGNVEAGGGGVLKKSEEQPYALGYAPGETLRGKNANGKSLRITRDGKR